MAGFTHVNVVTVHDFGLLPRGVAFLVMELLDGHALREELEKTVRLTAPRTLETLRGVCAAVDAAHRRHLVHRDLKPENIFLSEKDGDESVKVLDFGVVKFLSAAASDTETQHGILLGTLPYMAPERFSGEQAQPTWDVWSLAVTAYEMLAGTRPFQGTTPAQLRRNIASGRSVPLSQSSPARQLRCQAFFDRAFAQDLDRRPTSARLLLRELEQALG